MSTNVFGRLRTLLPPPAVLIGRVVEHHEEDDTSTIELPTGVGLAAYADGLATGALIRPRGRSVPVGANAFVRNGVVETRAPDGEPLDIVIGGGVCQLSTLTFTGPIEDQLIQRDVPWVGDASQYFSGGFRPYAFALSGALPTGLTFDPETGQATGTPTVSEVAAGLVVSVTDSAGVRAQSNAFDIEVTNCFLEPIDGNALSSYTLISGNPVLYSTIDTPSGKGIQGTWQDAAAPAVIQRTFSAQTMRVVSFNVRVDNTNADDGMFLIVREGAEQLLSFTPRREVGSDATQRPHLSWRHNSGAASVPLAPVYPTAFLFNRWYRVEVYPDVSNMVCRITDLTTMAAVSTAAGSLGTPPVDRLLFHIDSGGVTSGATYSAITICP